MYPSQPYSASLPSAASNVELMGSLESEFTPQQLANFRQAFSVFDVNKDGRISTQEIFEVLHTMGNEVTAERQAKIKAAVVAVDLDQSGDLDFEEFIRFMKIMDEHNKVEAVERKQQAADVVSQSSMVWKYFSCIPINVVHTNGPNIFWEIIVWLAVIYGVGHAIFLGILIATTWDTLLLQNPQNDTNQNTYATYVLYIRYANYANFLCFLLHFTGETKIAHLKDALKYNGYEESWPNLLKFIARPIIILDAASCVIFILGYAGIQPTTDSIRSNWIPLAVSFAVIAIAFFSQSFFIFFHAKTRPAGFCDYFIVVVTDILIFNWIRSIVSLIKMGVSFLLLPVNLVFSILLLFSQCICPSCFNVADAESNSSRFLRIVAFVSG